MTTPLVWSVYDFCTQRTEPVDAVELARRFDRDGVLIFPDFLDAAELPPLRRALVEYFAPYAEKARWGSSDGKASKHGCDVVPWNPLESGSPPFVALSGDARLHAVTEAVLGEGFTVSGGLVMFSVGGGRGQAWHQDCPAEATDSFNLNRLFYTEDVKAEHGALVFVPGSHRAGTIPPGGAQEPMEHEVFLTPQAGAMVFLHGHVYHRVTPNLGVRPRVSVNFRAYPKGVSSRVNCIGVYRSGRVNFCDKPKMHDGTPAPMMAGVGMEA